MGHIYQITNNIDGKIYIGQTRNPIKYRWLHHLYKGRNPDKPETDYPLYRAMRKYGIENFSISEVEEIDNNLLDEREIYWIKEKNSCVPNGYNCSLGGKGTSKFNHKEILEFFENEGKCNASETARHFNCTIQTVLKILDEQDIKGQGSNQAIYQISLKDGKIIKKYKSLKEAEQLMKLGRTQVWSAVNGQSKTAGGYAWCKVEDYPNFKLEEHINSLRKKLKCQENGLIFDSTLEAAEWINENSVENRKIRTIRSNVSKACKSGIRAYGFHWSYI